MISEGEVIIDRNPAAAPAVETIEPANPLRDAQIAFKLRELASALLSATEANTSGNLKLSVLFCTNSINARHFSKK